MAVSPLDSTVFAGVFGDPEVASLFSDEAEIAAMIVFERALARAQARCGVIPVAAAAVLDAAMAGLVIPPEELTASTTAAAVSSQLVSIPRTGTGWSISLQRTAQVLYTRVRDAARCLTPPDWNARVSFGARSGERRARSPPRAFPRSCRAWRRD